MIELYRN